MFDLGDADGKKQYNKAVKADKDHVRFDITVENSKLLLDLLTALATSYHWYKYLRIPTTGTGGAHTNAKILPSGEQMASVDLGDYLHLLDDCQRLSLKQVKAFASWIYGDLAQTLVARDDSKKTNMSVVVLDPNAAGNVGLVAQYKQRLRVVSGMITIVLKNHVSDKSYRSFFVKKNQFSFYNADTGDVHFCGFILLKLMIGVVKPSVLIDVNALEAEIRKMTILTKGNDFRALATRMEEIQQEINAQKGEEYYKDDQFLSELFRAAKCSKNEVFKSQVQHLEMQYVTGKISDKTAIVSDLSNIYRNLLHKGQWKQTNDEKSKIIALTTKLEDQKKEMNGLRQRLDSIKAGKSPPNKRKGEADKAWRFTNTGSTRKHPETGEQVKWCGKGHGNGCYMPIDHDHDEWVAKKAAQKEAREAHRAKKQKTPGGKPPAKEAGANKTPSKLTLSREVQSALLTDFHMSSDEASKVFDDAWEKAQAQGKE